MSEETKRSADSAAQAMIEKTSAAGIETAHDRHKGQGKRCPFGEGGTCCRICEMGPCRITAKNPRGICGADAATIAARHLIRQVAAGAAMSRARARMSVRMVPPMAWRRVRTGASCPP